MAKRAKQPPKRQRFTSPRDDAAADQERAMRGYVRRQKNIRRLARQLEREVKKADHVLAGLGAHLVDRERAIGSYEPTSEAADGE